MKMLFGAGRGLSALLVAALSLAMVSAPAAAQLSNDPSYAGPHVDTVAKYSATDRGAIIGFTGAQLTTTSGSPTVTLTTAPTSGQLAVGQAVTATGVPAGTTIAALASGTANTAGATYTLSANATASGTGVAATSGGPQTLMAPNPSRRGHAEQNQATTGNCYEGTTGSLDWHSLILKPGDYYDTPITHVGTGALIINCATPATPIYAREW